MDILHSASPEARDSSFTFAYSSLAVKEYKNGFYPNDRETAYDRSLMLSTSCISITPLFLTTIEKDPDYYMEIKTLIKK